MEIATILIAPTIDELRTQTQIAIESGIDILEFRLDNLQEISIPQLQSLIANISQPIIFTIRSKWANGEFHSYNNDRSRILLDLVALRPNYIDLEYPYDMHLLRQIPKDVVPVVSFIDFEGIAKINYSAVKDIILVRSDVIIKILATPSTPADLEKMWYWSQAMREDDIHHVVIGRGKLGKITRIKAPQFRNTWMYGLINKCMFEEYFEGMMTIDELERAYAPNSVHIGHIGNHPHHNFIVEHMKKLLQKDSLKGVLIDIELTTEADVYDLLKWMAKGLLDALFVDYRWQKYVVGYLDEYDESVKQTNICNLIILKDKKLIGYNTYYIALRSFVLEIPLNKIYNVYFEGINNIIETAIAFFGLFAENIVIRNRTKSKIQLLQEIYPQLLQDSETVTLDYQIVMNAIPFGTPNFPNICPVPKIMLNRALLVIDTILTESEPPLMRASHDVPLAISGEDFFSKNLLYLLSIIQNKELSASNFQERS